MKALILQFRNQALGFVREPAALIFNILVPFLIVLLQAFAFGQDKIGAELPDYRVVDTLTVNAGVMFTMVIGLFNMGVGLSSMIESRTLAGSSLRPYGSGLVMLAYALVLLVLAVTGWSASYIVLRLGWEARWPSNVFATIPMMMLSIAMFLMIGACIAGLTGTPRSTQGICSAVFFPLLFLSGAVFPVSYFPAALQEVAKWLPGYRVSELLYSTWLESLSIDWWSFAYVLAVLIMAGFTAKWLLKRREDV